jgi:7,8-dihydropterin-6-yl-methyl-4-(beta-D-ribofuranosyl)aminobenzene 5'-phosphate synthase
MVLKPLVLLSVVIALGTTVGQAPLRAGEVKTLKVTVLSTMLAGDPLQGIGEWGFAALIEADGRRLLVDTGARAETVARNAVELGVDLSTVEDLVLTHNHADHTGGLLTLRRELSKKNPKALTRAHVARGIFLSRLNQDREANGLLPIKADYEKLGGTFVEHAGPTELMPGVWLAGPIPRVHPERNFGGRGGSMPRLQTASGPQEDNVPEDTSVIIESASGLVVVTGCGHAGIVNTLEYARTFSKEPRVHAAIGGFHLFAATDDQLAWSAGKLREFGVQYLLGAHCTGIEAVMRIRQLAGLARKTAAVGAVGASFVLGTGIDPRQLAQ